MLPAPARVKCMTDVVRDCLPVFIGHGSRILAALAVTIMLFGCSKRASSPPVPKPIGTSDARIREAAPRLSDWVSMWRAAIPGFRAESLFTAGSGPALRGGYVVPLSQAMLPDEDALEVLSAYSPTRRFKLVFDCYESVSEEDGELSIGGDVDSAPLLLDLRDSVSNRFESCGTPCGYDWGVWLSPTQFALGGWSELDPAGKRFRGTLGIYSIPDSAVAMYTTRPVSAEGYAAYRNAWEQWVGALYWARKRQAAR